MIQTTVDFDFSKVGNLHNQDIDLLDSQ